MKIGILNIATGNYRHYFPNLYYTIKKRFLPDHEKHFFYFTDFPEQFPPDVSVITIERKGFPGDTLYRYHYFDAIKLHLETMDVLYYIDVDAFVNLPVGDEILPKPGKPLVGVAHPGFYNNHTPDAPLGTPEPRQESTAYIDPLEPRPCYWMGGFNGGTSEEFLKMASTIKNNIDTDEANDIVAVWHDESHLNRYFTTAANKVQSMVPAYGYPESWNIPFAKKILMLDKDHEEIRKL